MNSWLQRIGFDTAKIDRRQACCMVRARKPRFGAVPFPGPNPFRSKEPCQVVRDVPVNPGREPHLLAMLERK